MKNLPLVIAILLTVSACKKYPEIKMNLPLIRPQITEAVVSGNVNGILPGDPIMVRVYAKDEDGVVKSISFYRDGKYASIDSVQPFEFIDVFPQTNKLVVSFFAKDDDALMSNTYYVVFGRNNQHPEVDVDYQQQYFDRHPVKINGNTFSENEDILNNMLYLNGVAIESVPGNTFIFQFDSLPSTDTW